MTGNNVFFLGHSTPDGFSTHLSDDINSGAFTTYILKGGPGTGKSSLMKKVAAAMSETEDPEIYYCSSDPDSLDAVILRKSKAIIVDGTAPHVFEPKYPGVREVLIDLGGCWNNDRLKNNRENIIDATDRNQKYHAAVKRYLKAIITLNDDIMTLGASCLNKPKLDAYCDRLCAKLFPKTKRPQASILHRQISSITPKGMITHSEIFKDMTIFKIDDDYCAVSARLMSKLAECAASSGYDVIVSENVLMPSGAYQHIVIPELKIAFTSSNTEALQKSASASINALRFYDRYSLKGKKKRAAFDRGMAEKLTYEAIEALKTAKDIHDELESYYIDAMNFDMVNSVTDELILRLKKSV